MEHPKRYIYIRCSTDHQDYMQQMHTIQGYFTRMGIGQDTITAIYSEKVSGTVKHTERKLATLLEQCESGDYIYMSELSRLGRSMSDLFAIVTEASERNITIIQCKDGSAIENKSISGKALLFALGLAAEIEVANTRQRTQAAIDAIHAKIARGEEHISKSGKVCTHLGREKGCDTSVARAASIETKKRRAVEWRENNVGYNAVRRWVYAGQTDEWILEEFHQQHKAQPEHYSTPLGCDLTLPTLIKWKREFRLIK